MIRFVAITLLLLPVLWACSGSNTPDTTASTGVGQQFSIRDIVDGDTIKFTSSRFGEVRTARLIGYDTPETYEPGCAQELELGHAATRRLQLILRNAQMLEPTLRGTDRYQRDLMRLIVDGRDLADIMVSEGLAVRYNGGRRINWCNRLGAA